jgi:hypothetical protein
VAEDRPAPRPVTGVPRAFVLFGFDPATGQAGRPVAALVVADAGRPGLSWLPLRFGADEPWRATLAEVAVPWPQALAAWSEAASPVADLLEVPAPAQDPQAAAELLVDVLLGELEPVGWAGR